MAEKLEHIRFYRLEPAPERRFKKFVPSRTKLDDPAAHAAQLTKELGRAASEADEYPGFDKRLLVKLRVDQVLPDQLATIPGVTVVAQDEDTAILAFVDEQGRATFEEKLGRLAKGQSVTYRDLYLAIRAFDSWQPSDRLGVTLAKDGFDALPAGDERLVLDVELWPLELAAERSAMLQAFEGYCREHEIQCLDSINRENIVLVRVAGQREALRGLLKYRDVRAIDLPPRIGIDIRLITADLNDFPQVRSPPEGAPRVAVLDSGVTSGHPLLGAAVGDAQSFLPTGGPHDEHGHGTMVCGLAMYGDVEARVFAKKFDPTHWVVSGRILNAANEVEGLIENQIVKAVEYFTKAYNCRVFNLSIGDRNRPFRGARPGPWAVLLDELAHKHGVLFVVSAGNYFGSATRPANWLTEYPALLLEEPEARIIDPAPAINALTVGGLAFYEASRMADRFPNDPAQQPIARSHAPSPFTRAGAGVLGGIKPELVEHAGNLYVDGRVNLRDARGERDLGVPSTNKDFGTGRLFAVDSGTSYAAPKVTWLAAQILRARPEAGPNLIRALLAVHASVPAATEQACSKNGEVDDEAVRRLVGFGRPSAEKTLDSDEKCVTLFAEDALDDDSVHFFEIPIPEDFLKQPSRRTRRISAALAHTPMVRSSRLDYRASSFSFKVVRGRSLDAVVRTFKRVQKGETIESALQEAGAFVPSVQLRNRGTLQAATLVVRQTTKKWKEESLFLVVTRKVPQWARGLHKREPYALAVAIEDLSDTEVRLHTQVREKIRERVRARVRT